MRRTKSATSASEARAAGTVVPVAEETSPLPADAGSDARSSVLGLSRLVMDRARRNPTVIRAYQAKMAFPAPRNNTNPHGRKMRSSAGCHANGFVAHLIAALTHDLQTLRQRLCGPHRNH
jgi:hypothetical protein